MSDSEIIEIEISGREAKLILDYGYPFPDEIAIFESISGKKGYHKVSIDKYWLALIIADLGRSIRETNDYELQEELDELCSTLEIAMDGSLIRIT